MLSFNGRRRTSAGAKENKRDEWKVGSEDDASAARTSLFAVSAASSTFAAFGCCLFFVEHVLWFDGHVNDVGSVVIEFGVCWGLIFEWVSLYREGNRRKTGPAQG